MRSLFAATALLGVFSASALAQTVVGSAHDLSDDFTTPDNQVCIYCHAPHNALVAVPLWNHASTAQTFTMYSSSTLDNTIAGQPSSISKQCLSCHDGVTNIDAYGGGAGTENMGTTFPGSGAIMGTDLGNDHPVSINYDNTADLKEAKQLMRTAINMHLEGRPLMSRTLHARQTASLTPAAGARQNP